MANTSRNSRVRCVTGNATTAQVNDGFQIAPALEGKSYIVLGGWMRALGGAAATATSVDIKDTAGSAQVAVACGVAGLTEGAVLDFTAASNVTATKMGNALTADKGLKIEHTGGDLGTATSVDYCVKVMVV